MNREQRAVRHGEVVATRPAELTEELDKDAAGYLEFVLQSHADVLESVRAELEDSGQHVDKLLHRLRQTESLEEIRTIGDEISRMIKWARSLAREALAHAA